MCEDEADADEGAEICVGYDSEVERIRHGLYIGSEARVSSLGFLPPLP